MEIKAEKLRVVKNIRSRPGIIDAHTHVGVNYGAYITGAYPYGMSFEDLVIRLKYLNVDYAVAFPISSSYYKIDPSSPIITTTEEFSKFPYQLENENFLREVYEIFPEYSSMVIPFVLFDPSRKINEQVDWLYALYERYSIFGLKTIPTYIQSYAKDLLGKGRPILEFATKYGLPIIFHCSYYKNDPWASVFDIIKIVREVPEVRFCLAHSARFVKSVLDEANDLENCFVDTSAFHIHCMLAREDSDIIPPKEERFPAEYNDPVDVLKKLVDNYPSTIIWGSDIPDNYFVQRYYDANGKLIETKLKSTFDMEVKILKGLPQNDIHQIAYVNTVRFLFGD